MSDKFINVKLGKELKLFLNGSKKAIYINGKATNIKDLKEYKTQNKCPF